MDHVDKAINKERKMPDANESEDWSPEKKALAAQWLVEKRLESLREKMPPAVFQSWALSLDLLLAPLEMIAEKRTP